MCQWLRFAACSCCQWVLCILRICACPGASSCNLCPNGTYATALGAKRHCIVWQGAVAGRDSGIRQAKTLSMYLCLTVIAYSYSSPPYFRLILIIEPLESIVHLIIRYFLAAADYFYCIMLNFIINGAGATVSTLCIFCMPGTYSSGAGPARCLNDPFPCAFILIFRQRIVNLIHRSIVINSNTIQRPFWIFGEGEKAL